MNDLLKRTFVYFAVALFLSGCGIGLCVGGLQQGGCSIAGEVTPRLLLSGLDGLSIRKNDCYPVTLSALDAIGNAITDVSASVAISASSGVVLYSSLQGCQTYDSAFEKSAYALTPSAPSVIFYFRSDTEGAVSLSATTSASTGLAATTQPISVQYTAFDGSKGPSGNVAVLIQDASGRTYLGGAFQSYDDLGVSYVARLNADGGLDSSFLPTGTGLNGSVSALGLQSDGKVVVGGSFTSYNGTSRPRVARLNSDGSLDSSFALVGTGFDNSVSALGIQDDGKVLVGGTFTLYNGASRGRFARLNADGSLDSGFVLAGTGFNNSVSALAVQVDGKVLVAGAFTLYNGTSRPRIARLNVDGSLDATLAPTGSGLNSAVRAIGLQSDGGVLVGGFFSSYNGTSRPNVARLNADGSLDTSFVHTGTGLNGTVFALALQSNGTVVIGGVFESYNGAPRPKIARLNSTGSLDAGFSPSGSNLNGQVFAVGIQGDGRVLAGGDFSAHYNGAFRERIARFEADGGLDFGFASIESAFNGRIEALHLQTDGKLLVGGVFSAYNGTPARYLARVNVDGSLDSGFAQSGTGLDWWVYDIVSQSDGKVLVGGSFSAYNGTPRNRIARLNTDGSLDSSFVTTGAGFNDEVWNLSVQIDDKVVVGGYFYEYDGTTSSYLARLNPNGSLDTGFAPAGTGLNAPVVAVSIQSDGKILVGGDFTAYNGTSRPYLARLNADGSLDTDFVASGTGLNWRVHALALQSDGKVVVGGSFVSYNGTSRPYLARLNSDGSLDPSFAQAGTGFDQRVTSLALLGDGKLVVGGNFNTYNGTSRPHLARLNADGSLDTTFAPVGAGLNGLVYSIGLQSDGKVVVVGDFTAYGPNTASYLARLTYIGTLD